MFKNLLEALDREQHAFLLKSQQEFIDTLPPTADVELAKDPYMLKVFNDGKLLFTAELFSKHASFYGNDANPKLEFKIPLVSKFVERYSTSVDIPLETFCQVVYEYSVFAAAIKQRPNFKSFSSDYHGFDVTTIEAYLDGSKLKYVIGLNMGKLERKLYKDNARVCTIDGYEELYDSVEDVIAELDHV